MKSLSFSTWNIQGLNSSVFGLKSRHSDFMKDLEDIDVVILQETWCRGDVFTGCPSGYREIILPSVKLTSVTQGRDSGGMIIWIKSELAIELVKRDQYHLYQYHLSLFSYVPYIYPPSSLRISKRKPSKTLNKKSAISRPREMCCLWAI